MKKIFLIIGAFIMCFLIPQNILVHANESDNFDISVTTDKQTYSQNDVVNYMLTMKNTTSNDAKDVVLTVTLPEGLETEDTHKTADNKLVWNLDKINKSEEIMLFFSGKINADVFEAPVVQTDVNSEVAPQTGDNSNISLYIALLIISLTIILFAIFALKSKRLKKSATILGVCILLIPSFISTAKAEEMHDVNEQTHKITINNVDFEIVTSIEATFITDDSNTEGTDPENQDPDNDEGTNNTDSEDTDGDGEETDKPDPENPDAGDGEDTDKPDPEDLDGDGLSNDLEKELGTDPNSSDSDGNGIPDGEEVYDITRTGTSDTSGVTIKLKVKGKNIPHVTVENVEETNANFSMNIPGYLSAPFNFEGDFEGEATMTFTYDTSLDDGASFDPTIFYFNEDTGILEKVPGQTVDRANGTVTVKVSHFSTYLLLNGADWKEEWSKEFIIPRTDDSSVVEYIDIVFTVDSSGSMTGQDPNDLRKAAVKKFIDTLIDKDKGALVDFDSSAKVVVNLTKDHEKLIAKVDEIDSSGGTNLNNGLTASIQELLKNGTNNKKYIIFLTDGNGSYDSSVLDPAIANDIQIYTIGLGGGVREETLKEIADLTGGKYFFASSADELVSQYLNAANETTGPVYKDSDSDGISDYEETNGYFLVNVGMITTDPNNPDSDGDGIKDGDELGDLVQGAMEIENGAYANAYKWTSRPDMKDTDGDGINDKEDPNPIVKN